MQRLMSGQLSAEAAADLSGQLWFVYESLEHAVRSVAHTPIAGAVADPRLERRFALEADLATLVGSDWREKIRILPATASYVARLEEVSGSAAEVVAHHYVRYLGDISGGQVIAARLGTLYDIEPDALNFYDFSAIGKIPPYRKGYRERLDSLMRLRSSARHCSRRRSAHSLSTRESSPSLISDTDLLFLIFQLR